MGGWEGRVRLGPFQPVKGGLGGHLSNDHAQESNLSKFRFPCLMFSEQADANHASQEINDKCRTHVCRQNVAFELELVLLLQA